MYLDSYDVWPPSGQLFCFHYFVCEHSQPAILVDCFGMLHVVIYYVTQVFLISIHKRGNCLYGKHTLKKAFCAATHRLLLPIFFFFYHEIVSKIKTF